MKLPTPEQAFQTIRAVAIEHASGQEFGTCRCGHINSVHLRNWERCQGRHGSKWCDCQRFQGLNTTRQRQLERFGVALLAKLAEEKKRKEKT